MNSVRLKNLVLKALPWLLLSMLLVVADISFNKPDTKTSASDMLPAIPADASQAHAFSRGHKVLDLYQGFDAPEAAVNTELEMPQATPGLTQEQQQQQQGLLRVLYINDEMYRLSAIINQRRYVASLSVSDIKNSDSPTRRLLLKAGDTLHDYEVVSVTSRRITLRHQQRELWLQLFTPGQALPAEN